MPQQYRPDLKDKARGLRKNLTDAEQRLWQRLRRKQIYNVQFYRQRPLGRYIVDFYAPTAKLVIELDGSQHFESEERGQDAARDRWLSEQGLQVLRFDDRQALVETDSVIGEISRVLTNRISESSEADDAMLHIAVGVLVAGDGRVLIAQRRPGTPGAGKWEFPGGKREPGETIQAALSRELQEELGIRPGPARPLIRFSHAYSDRTVLLDIWRIEDWDGEVHGCEGQPLAWVMPDRLREYDLLSANKPVVDAIRLPDCYAITPEAVTDDLPAQAEPLFRQGLRLLRLRAPGLSPGAYEGLARQLQTVADRHGAELILDREPAMVTRIGAAGIHVPANRLADLTKRPVPEHIWFAASCHNRDELLRAHALGADFVTLSPVRETLSHPDVEPLGWSGFSETRADIALPVYALGGVTPEDRIAAWEHGAQGVAGIGGFFG